MPTYDRARAAADLVANPLLDEVLDEIAADYIAAFPGCAPEGLPELQRQYNMVEELRTRISNAVHSRGAKVDE